MDEEMLVQAAERVLRSYIIRCFKEVSTQYPEIAEMSPEDGADRLLKLRRKNQIRIELDTVGDLIECRIIPQC